MALPSPIPHPLAWWAGAPDFVRWGLDLVVGAHWPDGDERRVWDLADGWLETAHLVAAPVADAGASIGHAVAAWGGDETTVGQALAEVGRELNGDDAAMLPMLVIACGELGHALAEAGGDIEAAKLEMYIELGILVIELLGIIASAFLTFGASSAAAGPAVMGTRLALHEILTRMVKKVLQRAAKDAAASAIRASGRRLAKKTAFHAAREATEETTIEWGTEAYQVRTGHRESLSRGHIATAGLAGAAGGSLGGLAGLGPSATTYTGRVFERLARRSVGEALAETGAGLTTGNLHIHPGFGPAGD